VKKWGRLGDSKHTIFFFFPFFFSFSVCQKEMNTNILGTCNYYQSRNLFLTTQLDIIDGLIINTCTSCARIFHSYGTSTFARGLGFCGLIRRIAQIIYSPLIRRAMGTEIREFFLTQISTLKLCNRARLSLVVVTSVIYFLFFFKSEPIWLSQNTTIYA
jgi:hypothetical protein